MNTVVHHWRYEDGLPLASVVPKWAPVPPGWYCWVYTDDGRAFEKWMKENCPGADATARFNNGDPMYTVYIANDEEAMLFQLRWM